jgi:hypothetical protein
MSMLLFLIGIFVSMVGLLTVGFAIPLRDFDLGHSLIIAGAVAIVGGLIVFGLGAVVREVRRTGGRAPERAAQPTARQAAEAPAAAAAPATTKVLGRMPLPTPTPPVVAPRGRAEPRLDVPEPAAAQPQRPDIFATIRAGREPMPEAENVPLSPVVPPRSTPRPDIEERQPSFAERRPMSPATLASRTAARIDTPRSEPARPAERSGRNLFDTVWPTESRRAPEPVREAPRAEPMMAPPEHADERVPEPPRDEPAPTQAELPAPTLEAELAAEIARSAEPKTASIHKSGVIDGMAYTLYTDGAIEAQLPKGMMRFASIDELRQYLLQNG